MKKRGMTLIELLIAMAVLGLLMSTFAGIYATGMKQFKSELTLTRIQTEAQTVVDRINNDVESAQGVETSLVVNGVTYNADNNTLILKVPAVDTTSNHNFIYYGGNYVLDHIIYYRNGTTLHRLVSSTNSSSSIYFENNEDKTLLNDLDSASSIFTYLPDSTSTSQISTTLNLTAKAGSETKRMAVTGSVRFRNN